MSERLIVIILSVLVTQIPRTIPYFVTLTKKMPKRIRKCMMLLPLSVLGALIFPQALVDYGSMWYAGLIGVSASFVSSYFKLPMIVSIILALALTAAALIV